MALGLSIYVIIGVHHKEKTLIHVFADRYLCHILSTGKFFPLPAKRNGIIATKL